MRPRTFKYINGESDRVHYGLILDELREAIKSADMQPRECAAYVLDDPEKSDGGGGIRYSELIALCIDEIQKLKTKIRILESEEVK